MQTLQQSPHCIDPKAVNRLNLKIKNESFGPWRVTYIYLRLKKLNEMMIDQFEH